MLYDLSRTLATRRSTFAWRTSIAVKDNLDVISALEKARFNKVSATTKTAFLFTGQGAQYAAMGRELLHLDTNFRRSLERSQAILHSLGASWDLLEELQKPETESRINSSHISQPATTAVQIAIVSLLDEAGVYPTAVLGHSSGEVAAAYAAGLLDHEDAIRISYYKGFVADWCRERIKGKGAMLAVGLGEEDVGTYMQEIISGRASVACVNSPSSVTISGDEVAIEDLMLLLDRHSIFNRRLKVDIAYHSHHMDTVAARFKESIHGVAAKLPNTQRRFFSSVTGNERQNILDLPYWVDNLVSKVRFSEALQHLSSACCGTDCNDLALVEIGPHSALEGPIRQTLSTMGRTQYKWTYLPSLDRKRDSRIAALDLIRRLWELGVPVNLSRALDFGSSHKSSQAFKPVTDLPAYAWDHQKRYWHESRLSKDYRLRKHAPHDLLGLRMVGSTLIEPVFRLVVSQDDLPWLQEHIIDGVALYPGSAFLVHAIEGLKQVVEDRGQTRPIQRYWFRNVSFTKSIVVHDSPATVEVLISFKPSTQSAKDSGITWQEFRITSQASDGSWNANCHGLVGYELVSDRTLLDLDDTEQTSTATREHQVRESCSQSLTTLELYDDLRRNGIDYGENFSIIHNVQLGDHVAVGDIEVPDIYKCMPSGHIQPHVIHPATFDAFMHIALPLYHRYCSAGPVVLTSIGEVSISADILSRPGSNFTVVCDLAQASSKSGEVNVSIMQKDPQGILVEVGALWREEFTGTGDGLTKPENPSLGEVTSCSIDWRQLSLDIHVRPACPDRKVEIFFLQQREPLLSTMGALNAKIGEFFESSLQTSIPLQADEGSIQVVLTGGQDSEKASAESFALFARFESVLWVQLTHHSAEGATFPGQARRHAESQDRTRHIVLKCKDNLDGDALGQLVANILSISFLNNDLSKPIDMEYWYHQGTLYVPRLQVNEESNSWLHGLPHNSAGDKMAPFHCGRRLKLAFKTPGLLSSGIFIPDNDAGPLLEADYLEVKVLAYAVNSADIAAAFGRLGIGESTIGEFAGVVLKVGGAVPSSLKPGDRVCGWGARGLTNIARVRHQFVQHLDDSVSFAEGAAIPIAFQTALHALVNTACLQNGQRLLIHGATSDVGQAAISIAQHIGANIYATATSADETSLLSNKLRLPRSQLLSGRDGTFQRQLQALTSGKGVDLVLNCSHAELATPSMPCIADSGMAIILGKGNSEVSMPACQSNVSCAWIDLNALRNKQPQRLQKLFSDAMTLCRAESLHPPTRTVLPIAELEKAFRLANSKTHLGKIILEADNQAPVLQSRTPQQTPHLDEDSIYAVLGGTSTLNMELCSYLAQRGAKKILGVIFDDSVAQLGDQPLRELQTKGVSYERLEVVFSCALEVNPGFRALQERIGLAKGVLVVEAMLQVSFHRTATLMIFTNLSSHRWRIPRRRTIPKS